MVVWLSACTAAGVVYMRVAEDQGSRNPSTDGEGAHRTSPLSDEILVMMHSGEWRDRFPHVCWLQGANHPVDGPIPVLIQGAPNGHKPESPERREAQRRKCLHKVWCRAFSELVIDVGGPSPL